MGSDLISVPQLGHGKASPMLGIPKGCAIPAGSPGHREQLVGGHCLWVGAWLSPIPKAIASWKATGMESLHGEAGSPPRTQGQVGDTAPSSNSTGSPQGVEDTGMGAQLQVTWPQVPSCSQPPWKSLNRARKGVTAEGEGAGGPGPASHFCQA